MERKRDQSEYRRMPAEIMPPPAQPETLKELLLEDLPTDEDDRQPLKRLRQAPHLF